MATAVEPELGRWIIEDWTGRNIFRGVVFMTFDDAWDFVRDWFPDEEDWQEIYVEPEGA